MCFHEAESWYFRRVLLKIQTCSINKVLRVCVQARRNTATMTDPVPTVPKIKMRACLSQDMGLVMAAVQLWVGVGERGSMPIDLRPRLLDG